MSQTAAELRTIILSHVESELHARGLTADSVPDDYDLLAEGVIDSFGFLELIVVLEASVGSDLDLAQLDPADLTVVGRLASFASAASAPTSI